MTRFTNTAEYWAGQITEAEQRMETLQRRYNKLHMVAGWDFQRALTEIDFLNAEIEMLYGKLDDAHRLAAQVAA